MKKFILLLIFVVSMIMKGNSQNYNLPIDSTGNVVYQEVINCSLSKSKLYTNAQDWIAKTFGDYKNVVQFEDKTNGKIILKGTNDVKHIIEANIAGMSISNSERILFTLTIECRENKYRYTMDNIVVVFSTGGQYFENSIFNRINDVTTSRNKIEKLNQMLRNLKNTNITSYNKRQLKKYQSKIKNIEQQIEYESSNIKNNTEFINSEQESIKAIILSLKNAMLKSDNF